MKQKVINVSYRKDSQTFPDWMKYEIELLNEDGSTQKIPAYGKDLQDALSRVVHDQKLERVEQKTKRIPDLVWAVLWFGYMIGLVELTWMLSDYKWNGIFFLVGIGVLSTATYWAKNWFKAKNIDK